MIFVWNWKMINKKLSSMDVTKAFIERSEKSKELNVDSEKIKASDQVEKFENKINDISKNIEEISYKFDIEIYQIIHQIIHNYNHNLMVIY